MAGGVQEGCRRGVRGMGREGRRLLREDLSSLRHHGQGILRGD